MNKKNKKFLSFDLAIDEILSDFRVDTEQNDLFADLYTFLAGGEAVVGKEECPPFGIECFGIWYRPSVLDERVFYSLQDFHELLEQAFSSKSPDGDEICKIYGMVMGVKAYVGSGPFSNAGIWVETETELFSPVTYPLSFPPGPIAGYGSGFRLDVGRSVFLGRGRRAGNEMLSAVLGTILTVYGPKAF